MDTFATFWVGNSLGGGGVGRGGPLGVPPLPPDSAPISLQDLCREHETRSAKAATMGTVIRLKPELLQLRKTSDKMDSSS